MEDQQCTVGCFANFMQVSRILIGGFYLTISAREDDKTFSTHFLTFLLIFLYKVEDLIETSFCKQKILHTVFALITEGHFNGQTDMEVEIVI